MWDRTAGVPSPAPSSPGQEDRLSTSVLGPSRALPPEAPSCTCTPYVCGIPYGTSYSYGTLLRVARRNCVCVCAASTKGPTVYIETSDSQTLSPWNPAPQAQAANSMACAPPTRIPQHTVQHFCPFRSRSQTLRGVLCISMRHRLDRPGIYTVLHVGPLQPHVHRLGKHSRVLHCDAPSLLPHPVPRTVPHTDTQTLPLVLLSGRAHAAVEQSPFLRTPTHDRSPARHARLPPPYFVPLLRKTRLRSTKDDIYQVSLLTSWRRSQW